MKSMYVGCLPRGHSESVEMILPHPIASHSTTPLEEVEVV